MTNARALRVPKLVAYHARLHELRLLMSYVVDPAPGFTQVQHDALEASAGHIRRFVVECAGMGLLTGSVENLYGWTAQPGGIANFDVLPAHLRTAYPARSGIRPDLLFTLHQQRVAGEARGRSVKKAPRGVTRTQQRRLTELATWSRRHHNHPVVMSWASMTPDGITVDLFHPPVLGPSSWPAALVEEEVEELPPPRDGEYDATSGPMPSPANLAEPRQWTAPPYPAHHEPDDFEVPSSPRDLYGNDETGMPSDSDEDEEWREPGPATRQPRRPRRPDRTPPELLQSVARAQIDQMSQELYQTASDLHGAGQVLFDVPVRGVWVPADLLGLSSWYLFFGILAHPLQRVDVRLGSHRPLVPRSKWDVMVSDRLVVVMARTVDHIPRWPQIEEALIPPTL
ncbi:hypothetical protein ACWDZ8_38355 [Streptomyces sp. NPDC003233]